MSTFRQDPTTNEWVILAPRRSDRPHLQSPHRRPPQPALDPTCPFCPGNEDRTPPEVSRRPRGEAGGSWRVRVFANLYPAVTPDGNETRDGIGPFHEMHARGGHEVVVESPRHDARLDQMEPEDIAVILEVWRERYHALLRRQPVRAVVVFKNFGAGAGTSLLHLHSQIVGIPVYPPQWLQALGVSMRYLDDTGTDVYSDIVAGERTAAIRLVTETDRFIAFCPFASTTPFEIWIVPNAHRASFGNVTDDELPALAEIIRDVLGKLRIAAGDPDFNLVVHSAPAETAERNLFRWHLRILPRLTLPAGFELGSGMSINTVMPEDAAEALRASAGRTKRSSV